MAGTEMKHVLDGDKVLDFTHNAALLYRERTGKGQYLDISLLDSYFH